MGASKPQASRPEEPGPADAARRALRAARAAAASTSEGQESPGAGASESPGGQGSVSEESEGRAAGPEGPAGHTADAEETASAGPVARPGDAARAALRRAVVARRGLGTHASQVAPDTTTEHPGGAADGPTPDADGPTPDAPPGSGEGDAQPSGARPADLAREALRAARAEARQAGTDAGDTGDDAGRRRSARPRRRTDSGDRARGVRDRDVRELLAGAFRMPPETDMPEEPPADNTAGRQASSAPHPAPRTPPRPTAPATPTPPPTPHLPRSMAAPARDGDHRRTFAAFPPRTPDDGSRFAETWWGNAWVSALEEGALDVKRLARGRGYADMGHVDAITVTPGLVLAYVRGSRPRPYRVQVRLRTLGDADWDRFLDAAVERPGHIAALLDKELPHSLADCGVPLLPGPGDLEPHCTCPDRGHPCKHAAALCYQTARLLDADPFVLLLLRGRGEREVLDALSRRNATRAARAAQEQQPAPLPGVRAAEALAPRQLPPLPTPLPVPPHPEQPPVYPAAPGGPDPFALDQLATDAAARAHALLSTGRDEVGELTLWQDAVRLAAARPGSGLTAATRALYSALASAADRSPAELARAVAAWRQGGLDGLAVLEEPWDPPAGRFDRARPLLLGADLPAFRPWRNRLTHPQGHVQLRLGRDGLWYAYESEPGDDDWWPRGTPDLDPVGALTGLGAPNEL
ncbi:SWIM zinc finger family protein [Streptomyces sp. HUAS ZL42]|uniref:SWIM zinc finger family protein n=1 Tax=Streptomyces sp. HUAS ZL42 TaxID=3231715 RepID=UPI00345EACD5